MGEMIGDLKQQGVAVMIMVGIAIVSILAMVILEEFKSIVAFGTGGGLDSANHSLYGIAANASITAFVAGFAIVGTFATVTMLIIVVKGIIGVVKGLQ